MPKNVRKKGTQSAWSARSAQSAQSARSAVCSLHGLRFGVTGKRGMPWDTKRFIQPSLGPVRPSFVEGNMGHVHKRSLEHNISHQENSIHPYVAKTASQLKREWNGRSRDTIVFYFALLSFSDNQAILLNVQFTLHE